MRVVQWILVPVVGFAAWWAAFLLGLGAFWVVDSLCPPEKVVSGVCTASWYDPAIDGLFTIFSAVAASFVVLGPVLVAPSHRRWVAGIAFVVGAGFATYMHFEIWGEWRDYFAALAGGLAAVGLVFRIWKRTPAAPG